MHDAPYTTRYPEGAFRTLLPWEGPVLLHHLSRLPAEDLRIRFRGTPSDNGLATHARCPLSPNRLVIGWATGDAIRGVVELCRSGRNRIEMALSVEPGFRNCGVGSALLRRALHRAALLGAVEASLVIAPANLPMQAVARRCGASMSPDGDELVARLALPRPDGLAFWFEVIGEALAQRLVLRPHPNPDQPSRPPAL